MKKIDKNVIIRGVFLAICIIVIIITGILKLYALCEYSDVSVSEVPLWAWLLL